MKEERIARWMVGWREREKRTKVEGDEWIAREREKVEQRWKSGVDLKGGGWCRVFITRRLQQLAMELSSGMMIFGQGHSISNVLIIPKWRECQAPVTVAIFTVLKRSQHWPCDGTPARLVWQANWIERSDQPADDCQCASVCVDWKAATKGETFRHCFGWEEKKWRRHSFGLKETYTNCE